MTDSVPEKKPEDFAFSMKHCGILASSRTRLRNILIKARWFYLAKVWGMDIHPQTLISLKASLDRTYPEGIHIGEGTMISFNTIIMTHDMTRNLHFHTRIGRYCAIGACSIIMPGVNIGSHSVIGAGTVVTRNVPPRSIVVGNPGRVVRTDIMTDIYGRITDKGVEAHSPVQDERKEG